MTQDIKAQLSDSYGNVGNVYSYTVEEYANYLMDHANSYSSKEVAIAKAMMTYGYYAQEYFDYQTNRLPSRINELENVNLDSYAYRLIDNNDALNFVGARLVLTSKPGLKLYFKGDVSFKGYTTTKEEGLSVITVLDIENMEQIYTFSMDDFLLKYGIFSYGKKAMETDNEALIHLIQAMYAYQKSLLA
ncbi:MAG: hypothetical protein Q4C49_03080 [Bacillota bacterium]|nr:hypothetical protein [Bacillota bacterium]